jgi:hypothetical protein
MLRATCFDLINRMPKAPDETGALSDTVSFTPCLPVPVVLSTSVNQYVSRYVSRYVLVFTVCLCISPDLDGYQGTKNETLICFTICLNSFTICLGFFTICLDTFKTICFTICLCIVRVRLETRFVFGFTQPKNPGSCFSLLPASG